MTLSLVLGSSADTKALDLAIARPLAKTNLTRLMVRTKPERCMNVFFSTRDEGNN